MIGSGYAESLLHRAWFQWSIAICIGFPLIAVFLGEAVHHLERRRHSFVGPLRKVRNLVLPNLVLYLLVRRVLEVSDDSFLARITATFFWILLIHTSLLAVNTLLLEESDEESWLNQIPALLQDLSRLFLVAVGAAIVLSRVWGFDLARLLTALGVGSVVLGLALQDTLGNMFSGVTLLFEKPLRVGDWLEIDGKIGQVLDINWRTLHLETLDREFLIIPNGVLSKKVLKSFSFPTALYSEVISFGFSYQDPPNRVKQVLKDVAFDLPWVLSEPAPVVLTDRLGDTQIHYKLKLFIRGYQHSEEVRNTLSTRLWYAAKRNRLELQPPSDFSELIPMERFGTAASEPLEQFDTLPAQLARVRVFRAVGDEMLREVALASHAACFGRGETLVHKGAVGQFFYVILDGRVVLDPDELETHALDELGPGDFFGELSLLLSESTVASVIAATDVEVLMIPPHQLHRLLEAEPDFARQVGRVLESRRRKVRAFSGTSLD